MAGETLSDSQALAYIASYTDLIAAFGMDAAAGRNHYALHAGKEGRVISFDASLYLASYPDLLTAFGTDTIAATRHYILRGHEEGRTTTGFDALEYLASNADLVRVFGNDAAAATRHYIQFGFSEGRATDAFDALEYLASNADLIRAFGTDTNAATRHYIKSGLAEGRATDAFDALEYLASNADLIGAFRTDIHAATRHYIQFGLAESRSADFDAVAYLLSNPDLSRAGLGVQGALKHWVSSGYAEGRWGDGLYGREQANHELSFGSNVTATFDGANDRDWFQIDLAAGQKVTLDLTVPGSALGSITVYNSAGIALSANDATKVTGFTETNFTAATAGKYYVSVSASGSITGPYSLSAMQAYSLLTGTAGSDHLEGTVASDHIRGLGGDDILLGLAGNDLLEGGEGSDTLDGGYGDDVLYGHSISAQGYDSVTDAIFSDNLSDYQGGNDRLYGQGGDDILQVYRDYRAGGPNTIMMDGGDGNDILSFSADDGRMVDTITAIGGAGADQISIGRALSSTINAGAGDDNIYLDNVTSSTIDAGGGNDAVWIDAFSSSQIITLGEGADVLRIQTYYSPDDDEPEDGSLFYANTITLTDFKAGIDRIDLSDFLDRGLRNWDHSVNPFTDGHLRLVQSGSDTLLQLDRDAAGGTASWVTLLAFQNTVAATLTAVELGFDPAGTTTDGVTLFGTAGYDQLNGTRANDHLLGLGNDDSLYGDAGNDVLEGGAGHDWLDGGYGDDALYGHSASGQDDDGMADDLYDYQGGNDRLYGQGGDDTLQVHRDYRAGGANTILMDGGEGNDNLSFIAEDGHQVDTVTLIGGNGNDGISVSNALNATIDAGEGADNISANNVSTGVIDTGAGNDTIWVDAFATSLSITLGEGSDAVMLQAYYSPDDDDPEDGSLFYANTITLTDFQTGTDRVDLSDFLDYSLQNWDHSANPFTDGHLRLVQSGTDTLLQVNRDGAGTAANWATLFDFQHTSASSFTAAELGIAPFVV